MTKGLARALGAILLTGVSPLPLAAQGVAPCADRDTVLERLASHYGETRQSVGLGANNRLVEVFASEETGSWTITVTLPTGKTCLLASGEAFEAVQEALLTPEKDA